MIRAAVFDLDGTLVDSAMDLALAVNHALRGVGLPERPLEEIAGFVGEGAVRLVEQAVAPRADLAPRALSLWWEHYQAHLLDHTTLYPGMRELLESARVPLAVHTNKPGRLARRILEGLGVLHRFAAVLGGDEAPRKPDPAGTRQLLERLGVPARDAVLVGDSLVDLETARAVPMPLVAVTWGLVSEARLVAAGAELRLHRVEELAPWVGAAVDLEGRIRLALLRRDLDAACSEAMRGYGPQILSYLRAVVRDPEGADEVFSQFCEDVWRGLAGFRGESSVRVWAYKLAWHAASRYARDPYRRRRQRLGTTLASRLAESVMSTADLRVEKRAGEMEKLRELLAPEERALLVLRVDRELSWREVAQALASDEGPDAPDEAALRQRFRRLREKLARLAREEGLLPPE